MEDREFALLKLFVKKSLSEKETDMDLSKEIEALKDKDFGTAKDEIIKKIEGIAPKKAEKTAKKSKAEKPKKAEKTKEEQKAELEKINKLVQEANNNIKCEDRDINKHYERLRKSVDLVAKGYFNSTFLQSVAGLGKSFQVTAKLNELGLKCGKDYIEFSGDMSPAFVYRFVYENNGKIVIFRDLHRLLQDLRSLDLIKAMTETHGDRIVRRAIYSRDLDDMPMCFKCDSRFIFEFNSLHLNGLKDDLDAMLSRGDYVNLVLSIEDIANIMKQIAKEEWQREVTDFLISNYRYVGQSGFNLRTQHKAFQVYRYCQKNGGDWKEDIKSTLTSEMSYIRKTLYSLIGERAIKSADLKRILTIGRVDGVGSLRSADRRIRDWTLLRELFIVGFVSNDDDELENYLNTHKSYAVCINPIEFPALTAIKEGIRNTTDTTDLGIKTTGA